MNLPSAASEDMLSTELHALLRFDAVKNTDFHATYKQAQITGTLNNNVGGILKLFETKRDSMYPVGGATRKFNCTAMSL